MNNHSTRIAFTALLVALATVGMASAAEPSATLAPQIELELSETSVLPAPPPSLFLPGADMGGAGATNKIQDGEKPQNIRMEDHLCCSVPGGCDCLYWPGAECNLFGCQGKAPGTC